MTIARKLFSEIEIQTLSKNKYVKRVSAKSITYWKAEAELLKKIEPHERQVKNNKLNAALIFEVIQDVINKFNLRNMISHLCKIAEVSKSGYYSYLKSYGIRKYKEERDWKLKSIILKAFNHRGYKRGSRSIKMVLEHEFKCIINRKCTQRIMRKYNIV